MGSVATAEREEAWATEPGALRRLGPLFVAGGLAGMLAGGIGSRVAMRIAALAAPDAVQGLLTEAQATIGRITLGGTLFLVVFAGIGSAIIGTAFYLAVREWLPTRRWKRALAFGLLELLVFGSTTLDPGNRDFTILGRPLLNVAVFASLFVLHGVLLVMLQRPSRRIVEAVGAGVGWREGIVTAATGLAAALTALGVTAAALQSGGSWARLWRLTLIACAAGLAFVRPDPARLRTRRAMRMVGGAALVVIALSGALELFDGVTTIV